MVELMDSYSEIYEIAHTYVHILDQLNVFNRSGSI